MCFSPIRTLAITIYILRITKLITIFQQRLISKAKRTVQEGKQSRQVKL
jgi:hypothetical protein